MLNPPLPYRADYEEPEIGEEKAISMLNDTMQGINDTTSKHYGRAVRASFAKSFALLDASLTILPDLAPELAHGLFAQAGRYDAVIRMSTSPGDILPDSISTARGLALKIFDVPSERLAGSEQDSTQDFIFINAPYFLTSSLKTLEFSIAGLAATTDRIEGVKKVVSKALQGVETVIEGLGMKSTNVTHTGGQLPVDPLGDEYFTMAPTLFGPYMAKFRLRPDSAVLRALKNREIDLNDERPDALREEASAHFAQNGAEWLLEVQFCRDIETMPIEDSSIEWDEEDSPFIPVARLEARPQQAWSQEKSQKIDDCMSFNPWHGLNAHRPIGSIMRGRKKVYPTSSEFRGRVNGCPMHR